VIPDDDAARDCDIRIVDESGEHYLYTAACFLMIELPVDVRTALLQAR
jgi:hypothetical protein